MSLVHSFTHLKDRPKADRALPLLQKIASLVKPIMRKHGWTLPVLAEFFPDNESLVGLNVNGGQKILLRLRPAWAPDTFYDEEQLVAVMLHELTHNVHGPHDDKFYKFLAGLEAEYEELKRTGYSGEAFYSKGHRLGAGVSHNLPVHLARARAADAAEKRRAIGSIMGTPGGRKLGGSNVGLRGLSPRELAARAAERRAKDEKSCGTQNSDLANQEAEKAKQESIENEVDIIDLTMEDDVESLLDHDSDERRVPVAGSSAVLSNTVSLAGKTGTKVSAEWICPACTLLNEAELSQCELCQAPRPKGVRPQSERKQDLGSRLQHSQIIEQGSSSKADWECPSCTFLNPQMAIACTVCLSNRPRDPPQILESDGWTCMTCGEAPNPHDFWSCRFCGNIKQSSSVA